VRRTLRPSANAATQHAFFEGSWLITHFRQHFFQMARTYPAPRPKLAVIVSMETPVAHRSGRCLISWPKRDG
jgi:hypothetical protein